jgi:hypothetical protein
MTAREHLAGRPQHHRGQPGAAATGSASVQVLSSARELATPGNMLKLEVDKF